MNAVPSASDNASKRAALITGGSKGIGLATAIHFARVGVRPIIAARGAAAITSAIEQIEELTGVRGIGLTVDLADVAQCSGLIARAVEKAGRLDILVNNAALFSRNSLDDIGPSSVAQAFSVNFTAPLVCGQAFVRHVRETGNEHSAIINISSISALASTSEYGLYAATKAALESLTRTMAVEWSRYGITVNAVAPGHVATESVNADIRDGRLVLEDMASKTPAHRIGQPQEVAHIVVFLANPEARHIVGQTIVVDGGQRSML